MIYWSYKMKIRKSQLKTIVEEVMNEASGLAKADPKKMAKGPISGPRPNEKAITNLIGGTNGWSGLTDKLDKNIAALKKAKAIDAATAKKLGSQVSQMIKTFRAGTKAQTDSWKKTGKQ